jgi:hypothetical protein
MNGQDNTPHLGETIISWVYKPRKSNKFLYAAGGVVIGLVIAVLLYGEELVPWLKKVPSFLLYLVLIGLSPLLKGLSGLGKTQEWTLGKKGFAVSIIDKGKSSQVSKAGYWKDYKNCRYDKKGVKLIPVIPMRPSMRIYATNNIMEVYSICRERISMSQAEQLDKSSTSPARPNTREQRQIRRAERRYGNSGRHRV